MQKKLDSRHTMVLVSILIFLGLLIWGGFQLGHILQHVAVAPPPPPRKVLPSPPSTVAPLATQETRWRGSRLVIPSLHVDAPLEPVGVLPNGTLGVPVRQQWDGVG